jgi:ribokinase
VRGEETTGGWRLRLAVIGHIEWVTHARVPFIPAAGQIVYCDDPIDEPAGGGAVTAVALARMGAEVTFYTALGSDARAQPILEGMGVRLAAARRDEPQTPVLTLSDVTGERTIMVVGTRLHPSADDPLPWDELGSFDGVYFTGDDPRTLRLARAAPVVVVTARHFEELVESGVEVEALVGSRTDPGEQFDLGRLERRPRHVLVTDGARGGEGWTSTPPPGPIVDAYGAGDTFLAGLLYGLAGGQPLEAAIRLGANRAAEAVTWRGAYPPT